MERGSMYQQKGEISYETIQILFYNIPPTSEYLL